MNILNCFADDQFYFLLVFLVLLLVSGTSSFSLQLVTTRQLVSADRQTDRQTDRQAGSAGLCADYITTFLHSGWRMSHVVKSEVDALGNRELKLSCWCSSARRNNLVWVVSSWPSLRFTVSADGLVFVAAAVSVCLYEQRQDLKFTL